MYLFERIRGFCTLEILQDIWLVLMGDLCETLSAMLKQISAIEH